MTVESSHAPESPDAKKESTSWSPWSDYLTEGCQKLDSVVSGAAAAAKSVVDFPRDAVRAVEGYKHQLVDTVQTSVSGAVRGIDRSINFGVDQVQGVATRAVQSGASAVKEQYAAARSSARAQVDATKTEWLGDTKAAKAVTTAEGYVGQGADMVGGLAAGLTDGGLGLANGVVDLGQGLHQASVETHLDMVNGPVDALQAIDKGAREVTLAVVYARADLMAYAARTSWEKAIGTATSALETATGVESDVRMNASAANDAFNEIFGPYMASYEKNLEERKARLASDVQAVGTQG